jgi:hypothetical protein
MSGHRRSGRRFYDVQRKWGGVLGGDEWHMVEDGYKWRQDDTGTPELYRPKGKKNRLSPVAHGRVAEKLEAELPEGYTVDFYRRKLRQWKTRTPKADVAARQGLAKALWRLTAGTRRRWLFCLLLDIDERRFDRLRAEGKKLSH